MQKTAFLLAVMMTVATLCHAQRFDASIWGGVNMGQIDGDGSGNYNHLGLHLAINSSFPLGNSHTWRLMVELGLTQKGSYVKHIDRQIDIVYVEIPVMLCANVLGGKVMVGAGIAPGINVRASVNEADTHNDALANNFKKIDRLPICASASLKLGNNTSIIGRWENSMLSVTDENATGTYRIFRSNKGSFHRLITIGVGYTF